MKRHIAPAIEFENRFRTEEKWYLFNARCILLWSFITISSRFELTEDLDKQGLGFA